MPLSKHKKSAREAIAKVLFRRTLNPTRMIIFGFIALILIGTVLLCLPVSSRTGQATDIVTALFTATSAGCVTGLSVVDTYSYWSPFGQCVVLFLIQCGGLGFMSLAAIFSFLLRRTITLRERLVMTQSMNINDLSGIVRMTRHILIGTFFFEFSGAVILSIRFSGEFGWRAGIAKGIFHSVSAFCNAGFDLMGQKAACSNLTSYVSDPIVNITIMALIIVGGLGFYVWEDIYHKQRFRDYTLHTKLVLTITASLLALGSIMFFAIEYNNPETLGKLSFCDKIMAAMFQATTTRTAGFNTISQSALELPSKMLSMLLMFIGGSTGSTAGGIKTVTFGILLLTAISVMRGKSDVTVFGRRLNIRTVLNAFALTVTAVVIIVAAAFAILSVQSLPVLDVIYEVISAFCTTGLSTGITTQLSTASRIILVALMFFGRVGVLTLSLALLRRGRAANSARLPEGKVMIG